MSFDILRKTVLRTHSTIDEDGHLRDQERTLLCAALGIAGESGELVDLIKKTYEQGRVLDVDKAALEIGDCLYYLQLAAFTLGLKLEDCITLNREKLQKRFPNRFSPTDALKRVDVP